MNHEIALLNKIIDEGSIEEALEADPNLLFVENKDIWSYILTFYEDFNDVPTKDVIQNEFKNFDFAKLDGPLGYYIQDAKKKNIGSKVRSSLFEATQKLSEGEEPENVLAFLGKQSMDILKESNGMTDANVTDWVDRYSVLVDRIESGGTGVLGIPSGIDIMDENFGGWQPGDFIVVIGWTGANKSFFTRLLAVEAWKRGYTPLVISLEMDRLQELYRIDTLLNRGMNFKNSDLMYGKNIYPEDYAGWAESMFDDKQPFYVVTSEGVDVADQFFVQAKIQQYQPDLVILDYHQLFEDGRKGKSEVERVKNLSKDFKKMAVRNEIPIIDVSGVTMDSGHGDRPPELNEISWSKQLSYDADLVLAVHRDAGSQFFQAITRKVRRGQLFAFNLTWDIDTGKWETRLDSME